MQGKEAGTPQDKKKRSELITTHPGLVDQSGTTVTPRKDFQALATAIKNTAADTANPSISMNAYTATNVPRDCPAVTEGLWEAAEALPPTPNATLCENMVASSSCVPTDATVADAEKIGSLFGTVCGMDAKACAGITSDAAKGSYGDFVMCNPVQQLTHALNEYYANQKKASSACDFDGQAKVVSPTEAAITPASGSTTGSSSSSGSGSSSSSSSGGSGSVSGTSASPSSPSTSANNSTAPASSSSSGSSSQQGGTAAGGGGGSSASQNGTDSASGAGGKSSSQGGDTTTAEKGGDSSSDSSSAAPSSAVSSSAAPASATASSSAGDDSSAGASDSSSSSSSSDASSDSASSDAASNASSDTASDASSADASTATPASVVSSESASQGSNSATVIQGSSDAGRTSVVGNTGLLLAAVAVIASTLL